MQPQGQPPVAAGSAPLQGYTKLIAIHVHHQRDRQTGSHALGEAKLWVYLSPTAPTGPGPSPLTHLQVPAAFHGEGEAPAPEAGHRVAKAGTEPAARGAGDRAIQAKGSIQLTLCTTQRHTH